VANKYSKRLVIGIPVATIILYRLAGSTVADIDLWGYMSFGRLFWQGGPFPYHDVFSYIPTKAVFIYHEWLTGVVLFKIFDLSGDAGLQIFKYASGFLTAGLIYITARSRGAESLSSAIGVLVSSLAFGIGFPTFRAQIFSYLFFVLSAYLLEKARQDASWKYLCYLPALQILWCNLHGGFVAGLGLIALYSMGQLLASQKFLPFLCALIASAVVTLLNPYGIEYWGYIFQALSMQRSLISEWWPVHKALLAGYATSNQILFIIFVLISVLAISIYRWKDITDILVLFTTAFVGLKSNRHEVFYFLSFGIYMPRIYMPYIDRLMSDPKFLRLVQRISLKVALALMAISMLLPIYHIANVNPLKLRIPSEPASPTSPEYYYPSGAVSYVENANLTGNVLSDFEWGEFIIWRLYPKCRVGMDGRYETVYPDYIFDKYMRFYFGADGWRNYLDDYPHDMVLIKKSAKVNEFLKNEKDWNEAYEDSGCVLYLRQGRE
jgi:hypothetical protein